jgi:hypothetical protein
MRFPRVRILSVMFFVAVVAVVLAGLRSGSAPLALLFVFLGVVIPVLAFLFYLARKLGLNTLFR